MGAGLQILRYASINIAEVERQPGKAAAWQVVFVSQALRKSRVYTFSVYEASATLHQGLFPDAPQDWAGGGKPFLIEAAKIDTDAAWETALKHGSDYNSKNPKTPISYTLSMDTGNDPCGGSYGDRARARAAFRCSSTRQRASLYGFCTDRRRQDRQRHINWRDCVRASPASGPSVH